MPELLIQVKEFIQKQAMPAPGAPVLVALSGGADSTALVLILLELGYEVVAAHCNFGLRAESDGDEDFVVHLADQKGFRLHVRRFEEADFISESGESTQQIARRLRYAFFEELMLANAIAHCAMAHHTDDETETLIQSFFRGNGPVILRGIPPQRGPYFRPLLGIPKADLLEFLRERGQLWRHDRSNDADDYRRNLVRNQLIPVLGKLNPGFQARFQGQAIRHAAQWDLLQALFLPLSGKVVEEEGG
ncbi:MAG TPA: tRNA lysidine(34) synthetase TilS, partial [Bacteroidia bacterium]|nr:tRNA lysidine(34) synthetase TilS [Bacteroidia bacterium]